MSIRERPTFMRNSNENTVEGFSTKDKNTLVQWG